MIIYFMYNTHRSIYLFSPGTIITGKWINPYLKDKCYFGNLFIYEENAILKLFFSREQIINKEHIEMADSFKDNKNIIIYGISGNKKYSLVYNYIHGTNLDLFTVYMTGLLSIETKMVYEGIFLEKENKKIITKAVLKTSYANKWIPTVNIKMGATDGLLSEQISYSLEQKTYHILSNKVLDIYFISGLGVHKEFNISQKIELQNEVRIEITAKTKINIITVRKYLANINYFIMLCTGNNSNITDVEFYYDSEQKFANKCWFNTTKSKETKHENIIDFAVSTEWNIIFSRWNNLCLKNLEILNMFFYILRFPDKFLPEMKTENFVHIFESLMRYKYGKTVSIKSKHLKLFHPNKQYPNDTISCGSLLGKFIFFFLENNKQIFQVVFERFLLSDSEETYISFIQNCISLRDYFSHGGLDERKSSINPILLNAILLKAIRFLLIRDILEISNTEIPLEVI